MLQNNGAAKTVEVDGVVLNKRKNAKITKRLLKYLVFAGYYRKFNHQELISKIFGNKKEFAI
jgi:hypothetical protein